MSLLRPEQLRLEPNGNLAIVWSDQVTHAYSIRQLRENCPCASCRERRMAGSGKSDPLRVLQPTELAPLSLKQITPVGNYAYAVEFSDGHDTGIFTLEFLRALGEQLADATKTETKRLM